MTHVCRLYMTQSSSVPLVRIFQQERVNFLLTNRIPRRWATLFMGWFSRIENPLVKGISFILWELFAGKIDISEAKRSHFKSLHDCFIRELRPGMRPISSDPDVAVSPCDGIVGAHGTVDGQMVFQAKGFPYTLTDLLCDPRLVERYCDGRYVTLRLKSTMYHRFHAPCDCRVRRVDYISGDTWNVNPIALKRIERLFCKNERAVIDLEPEGQTPQITLVPVAAILVASIKLHFLNEVLDLRYTGPNRLECDASFRRGEELGYFQHGSTIVVFAERAYRIARNLRTGSVVRMGMPLLELS